MRAEGAAHVVQQRLAGIIESAEDAVSAVDAELKAPQRRSAVGRPCETLAVTLCLRGEYGRRYVAEILFEDARDREHVFVAIRASG
jgi:hypothetical protein